MVILVILILMFGLVSSKVRSFVFGGGFAKAFLLVLTMFFLVLYVVKIEYMDCTKETIGFGKTLIKIKNLELNVLVAKTTCQVQKGLMNQKVLPEQGMLFVMPYERRVGFWMKNTLIPLSIAYIDKDGVILEIIDMNVESGSDFPVYQSSSDVVKYALEVNQGFFRENNINVNDQVFIGPF